jgi:hypothetical protein
MRKVLIFALMIGSVAVFAPAAEARTASAGVSVTESAQLWSGRQPRYRRTRSVIRTRIVRVGYRRYRETLRVTYYRNGRVRTQVIRRVRIR